MRGVDDDDNIERDNNKVFDSVESINIDGIDNEDLHIRYRMETMWSVHTDISNYAMGQIMYKGKKIKKFAFLRECHVDGAYTFQRKKNISVLFSIVCF